MQLSHREWWLLAIFTPHCIATTGKTHTGLSKDSYVQSKKFKKLNSLTMLLKTKLSMISIMHFLLRLSPTFSEQMRTTVDQNEGAKENDKILHL